MKTRINEQRLAATASILKLLYRDWQPHEKQALILKDIFYNKKSTVYAECGRKFGKTELIMAVLVRYAATHQNAGCYYIASEQKQAKEILWATGRIQRFIPPELVKSINNSEMRVNFHNGSFIKLDGSDNHESYRGIEPHCLVYDEYKDHHPLFHIAMDPNRGVYNAPLVIIGTPPEAENHATEMKESVKANEDMAFHCYSSYSNPHISKEWLDRKREELIRKGEEDVWMREYMAQFVRGGKNSVFPNIKDSHYYHHDQLMKKIERDKGKLLWYVTADPGTTTCFAVLFCALNPYTKTLYVLDEIYEQDQKQTSTNIIIPRTHEIAASLYYNGEWRKTYDEAAAWFANEASSIGDKGWAPTLKKNMKPDPESKAPWGVSIIKDMLYRDNILISDRCVKLRWEMENYVRVPNRDGQYKIPKKNDHLIDCLRYTLQRANYKIPETSPPAEANPNYIPPMKKRFYTIEEDMAAEDLDF